MRVGCRRNPGSTTQPLASILKPRDANPRALPTRLLELDLPNQAVLNQHSPSEMMFQLPKARRRGEESWKPRKVKQFAGRRESKWALPLYSAKRRAGFFCQRVSTVCPQHSGVLIARPQLAHRLNRVMKKSHTPTGCT